MLQVVNPKIWGAKIILSLGHAEFCCWDKTHAIVPMQSDFESLTSNKHANDENMSIHTAKNCGTHSYHVEDSGRVP